MTILWEILFNTYKMGVTFHKFKFLEYITKSQTLGNVLTLGRQELILNENK